MIQKFKTTISIAVLAVFCLPQALLSAPKYIDAAPLSSVIKTPVGEVRGGETLVPLITWGADIRTIYANGNARSSRKDSVFAKQGLSIKLQREDDFKKQIENYLSGKTPYLRGTLGMVNMAAEVLNKDTRTSPVIIYQLSESAGGDALVVKQGIERADNLKGKTVALQAYGPHVDYLTKILQDAGLSMSDVKLKWLPDLTGTDNSPMNAFRQSDVHAAMMIIPDALALTSGGNVGTGAEDSVKGARILLSTKTANRIIADVYAVRADYFKSHKDQVQKFVHALMIARDEVNKIVTNKASMAAEYKNLMSVSAEILLDSAEAFADTEGLYADAYHVDHGGNIKFFQDANYPRNFSRRTKEIQSAFVQLGMLSKSVALGDAKWDFNAFSKGLTAIGQSEAPRFDEKQVATVVAKKQQQGTLSEGELFSFEVFFQPNQNDFPADLYKDAFEKVISLASTYGGAVITIEGHSDPLGYLKQKKQGANEIVLKRVVQSGKNLSLTRAASVRDAIVGYAKQKNVSLDESQFATIGHGVLKPRNGMCGNDPCPPKNEQEWRDNMRVEFRIIQVEAEAAVFQPL